MSIREQIVKIKAEIDGLKFKLAVQENVLVCLQDSVGKRNRKRQNKPSSPPKEGSLAAHIKDVLTASEGPMNVEKLVSAISQRVQKENLALLIPPAIARRKDIFETVQRGVYDLKSRVKENVIE